MQQKSQLIQLYDATNPSFPAFPGNQVPILNPAAQYLFAHPELYPLPNQTSGGNQLACCQQLPRCL